jgi:hypothetical protein
MYVLGTNYVAIAYDMDLDFIVLSIEAKELGTRLSVVQLAWSAFPNMQEMTLLLKSDEYYQNFIIRGKKGILWILLLCRMGDCILPMYRGVTTVGGNTKIGKMKDIFHLTDYNL